MAPSVFLPALVYEIGNGALAPVIALTAVDLGASTGLAAFMLAVLGIGRVLGDIPASWLAEQVGDRRAMMIAAGLATGASLLCLIPLLPTLGLALVLLGMSSATYYLARQSYLLDVAPVHMRARALSTLGGSHRIGLFIGPFAGAAAIALAGLTAPYYVAAIASASSVILLFVVRDVEVPDDHPRTVRGELGSGAVFRRHWRLFATLGIAIVAVGAVRAARQTVLPLWSNHLGLSATTTSLIFGIASAVDMALFYPAGKVMDRFGRLSIALPSMLLLGGAMMAVPLTTGVTSLTLVAMTMSFGNGIGSGIMMTIGGDTAPAEGRVRFLGIWRFFSDSGNAAGPVVVSAVAGVATLAAGIVSVGSAGIIAAVALWIWVPRYSTFARRRDMIRANQRPRDSALATDPSAGA